METTPIKDRCPMCNNTYEDVVREQKKVEQLKSEMLRVAALARRLSGRAVTKEDLNEMIDIVS